MTKHVVVVFIGGGAIDEPIYYYLRVKSKKTRLAASSPRGSNGRGVPPLGRGPISQSCTLCDSLDYFLAYIHTGLQKQWHHLRFFVKSFGTYVSMQNLPQFSSRCKNLSFLSIFSKKSWNFLLWSQCVSLLEKLWPSVIY